MARRVLEIIAAVALGIIIVVVVFVVLDRGDRADAPIRSSSTLPLASPIDPGTFLEAWERSLTGNYAVVGTVERTRGAQREVYNRRQARLDGDSVEQTGRTAVVIRDGQRQICEVFAANDIRCGPAEAALTSTAEYESVAALFAVDGLYEVYAVDEPECFVVSGRRPVGIGAAFGQQTSVCFDQLTGALANYQEDTGDNREIFVADSISADVSPADLEPTFER
ncbi:MAG: hypothetical protein ACI8TP_002723 [Acidimicrobiales bacterium]